MVVRRLEHSVDFERVLRTRIEARSEHFALHHVADMPTRRHIGATATLLHEAPGAAELSGLSTGSGAKGVVVVDESLVDRRMGSDAGPQPPSASTSGIQWLGAVVPKRHARRAVTRSLIKRQIRAVVGSHATRLAGGLWVVRLRAPFDRARFVSAASDELRRVARLELDALIGAATRRQHGVSS